MEHEVRFLGDLQRLEVRPGDIFVLKAPGKLSYQLCDQLHAELTSALGGANKVIILDEGWELGVVGPARVDVE